MEICVEALPTRIVRAPRANRRKVFVHVVVARFRIAPYRPHGSPGRTSVRAPARQWGERLIGVIFEFEEDALGIDEALEWPRRKL